MLTREEANELNCMLNCGHPYHIAIGKFTEKLKRQIQVGDIYKNRHGSIIRIRNYHEHTERFIDENGWAYDSKGCRRLDISGADYRWDLDLSICYQLVEVEDE